MAERSDINRIRERSAQSYNDLPKIQQLPAALKDIKSLLAEVERLEAWSDGLQATALKWAAEAIKVSETGKETGGVS